MTITLNGTTGISNDGGYTGDGISFAESAPSNSLVVNSSGNVGIGTNSPAYKLHSATNIGSGSTGNNGFYGLKRSSDGVEIGSVNTDGTNMVVNAGTQLVFQQAGSEKIRMDTSGNFGVGTNSPSTYGKLGVVSGENYFGVATDAYTSALFGPRPANDGYCSLIMAYSSFGSLNQWKFDSATTGLRTYQNNTLKSYLSSAGEFFVGGATSYSATSDSSVISLSSIAVTSNNGFNFVANKPASPAQTAWMTFFVNGGLQGYINYTNPGCSYVNASDARLKENIVDAGSALDVVAQLPVRSFDWKEGGSHEDFGFVAQELHAVYPNAAAVGKDKEDGEIEIPWGVDPSKLVAMLAKAIQELKAEIDELKAKVN